MDRSRTQSLVLFFSIIVVVAIVAAAHWPALTAKAMCFDDDQYLTENGLVKNPSWNSASRFLREVLTPSTVGGYYQPLAMISLMLDYARGGRADNLYVFHQTSLLLHLLNTALVVILIFGLFGHIWVAAAAGLLFGLHPMTVETIAWVGERKTVLAAFFAFLSLNFYVGYARKGGWRFYALTVLMYVLALLSKPTSTPLPLLMLVMDYWPFRRFNRAAVIEKLPMFVIGGISGVITIISQARTADVQLPGQYPPMLMPVIACYSFIFYLSKIFYPVHLSSHYPFPASFSLSEPMVLASVISMIILIVTAAISIRRTRAFLAGLLFFFIGILPTMQLIGFSNVIASNKFAYLPSIGLLMVLASFLIWFGKWKKGTITAAVVVVLLLAGAEAVATQRYLVYWRNTESLYSHMIEISPNAAVVLNNFGVFCYKSGNVAKAAEEWSKAVELCPHYPDALNNLAWILATDKDAKNRDGDKAVKLAVQACQLTGYKDAAKLDTLAAAYAESGKFGEAVAAIQKGVQIAVKSERKELANEMNERLRLYQKGQAFRERSGKVARSSGN